MHEMISLVVGMRHLALNIDTGGRIGLVSEGHTRNKDESHQRERKNPREKADEMINVHISKVALVYCLVKTAAR